MSKYQKKIFRKNILIIIIIFFITILFINNGYALLNSHTKITGNTTINEIPKPTESCLGYLSYKKIANWDNSYTYQLFINNSSEEDYERWELTIYNPGFIEFPAWFEGEKVANGWILKDTGNNRFISKNSSISVIITFYITKETNMTYDEYAEYFIENFFFFTGCGGSTLNGETLNNGKANLTLGMYEKELNYTFIKNNDYESLNNEQQYILTIINDSNKDYLRIRGNMYLGNNKINSIEPLKITNETNTNINFESLYGDIIPAKSTKTIYITINEKEEITPELIIVGLIDV